METSSSEGVRTLSHGKVVVLIPCLNEQITLGKVILDFQHYLPDAEIIVFDNGSTDNSVKIAHSLGATVYSELRRGKGYVIASMFRKIDADYYIMVDGDDTYSAAHVEQLLTPLWKGAADMTVATRLSEYKKDSFRPLHVFGNNLVRSIVNWIFHSQLKDIMSGYRGFTRELVECVPILSSGFEVETELSIRTLDYGYVIHEVPVPYKERPEGSFSKLHTFRDGYRVLSEILRIARAYKPLTFFGGLGLLFSLLGIFFGVEVIADYLEDLYVNKVPTAILSTGCMILGFGMAGTGVILNTINYRFKETVKLLQRSVSSKSQLQNSKKNAF
ncbi:glycosyltransferase family 2 protein [Deltaproteobacteria bacterium TL4]